MAGITKLIVRVTGLREIKAKLNENTLLAPPFKDAMQETGQRLLAAAIQAAPVGKSGTAQYTPGGTRNKFRMRIQSRPMPLWVAVETTQTRSSAGYRKYSYPKRVEWDPKLHHAGWLRGVLKRHVSTVDGILARCARAIERTWSSSA